MLNPDPPADAIIAPAVHDHIHIVHELPRRLRVKLKWLNVTNGDKTYFASILERMDGVKSVRINAYAKSIIITYDGQPTTKARVLERLGRLDPTTAPRLVANTDGRHFFHMALSGMALAATPFMPPALRTAVMGVVIAPTILDGVTSLLTRGVTVEVLDGIAVGLAASRGDWFTALSTDFLIHMGEQLEAWTNDTSTDLLRQLLHPAPAKTWVEVDGELVEMATDNLKPNDVIVVGPGETIVADGQVVSGAALVNESTITGESMPVRKEAQARVMSGTIVEEGRLRVRAVLVGDDTTTARISRFIRESLETKSETQIRAEKEANQRIKITLGLGALTFLITRDLTRLASVFLVDYSCALKLGTPVAMKSTMYKGAKQGILIKGGGAIERMAEVDTVIFDKTGTLTYGQLDVVDVRTVQPKTWPANELLALVASIEEHSTHPIAHAVVTKARDEKLAHVSHSDVEFIVAHGLVSEVDDKRVVIGSRHFLEEHEGIQVTRHKKHIHEMEQEGLILLYTAVEGKLVGILGLRDRLRPEAQGIIEALRAQGIQNIAILTGDRRTKAEALAQALGINEVYAELEPEDKADIVLKLKNQGRTVAFVGDGVNDAPALVNANVGIAMPQGADIAQASADIILTDDRLEEIVEVRKLSTATMRLIKSNFNIAVGVNSGLFLAASMGWTSPVVSSLLHNGTTVGTLLRSLVGTRTAN